MQAASLKGEYPGLHPHVKFPEMNVQRAFLIFCILHFSLHSSTPVSEEKCKKNKCMKL